MLATYFGASLYTRTAIISPARTHIFVYTCYIFEGFISLRNSQKVWKRRGERVKKGNGRGPTIEKREGKEKRGNRGKRDEKNTHTEGAW